MHPTNDSVILESEKVSRLKRLFYARLLATFIVLLLFSWFIESTHIIVSITLTHIVLVWFVLLSIQWLLFRIRILTAWNILFQLTSDLILIGLLIYNSGGITSPIIFLLGIVIIVAGTQARVLIALATAVLASITYLIAIHTYASSLNTSITNESTLHILLQTSLFFLTGGIMALIARRHANLQQEQQFTTKKHQQLQELHSQVLSSMQEGIIILNDKLIIQDFNTATTHILQISSKHLGDALQTHLNLPKPMLNFIQERKGAIFRTEVRHHGQYLLVTLSQLTEKNIAWLMTIVNITETRKLERQLAEQDKLASIGQVAAMLAHEIRNPMQSIAQAVELMNLNNDNNNLERIVSDEISRLNRLVSDMLDYASPLHPHVRHTPILELIHTAITHIDLKSEHQIQVSCPDIRISIDPDHFRLVLDNLLRNAIQVSPVPASIELMMQIDKNQWSLRIRDHGCGISDTMRKTLFEPFHTGRKQGTGLGLATVWQVCQVNQWHIHIDEDITDGACFVISCQQTQSTQGEEHG